MEVRDKVAIITGAGSGIGRATALALAEAGCAVVLAGTTEARLREVADAITAAGGSAAHLACDVRDHDAFSRIRDLALERFGRIDIVMNNAAAISIGYPEDIPFEEWRRVFDINVMANVRSNHVFVPHLLAQGSGHLINVASVDGLYGFGFDRLPYAASKAALVQLSEGLALYLRRAAGEEAAAWWSIRGMMEHWNRKYAQAVYVPLMCQNPPRQYQFGYPVLMCAQTDFILFLKAFVAGKVYYDPGIKLVEKAGVVEIKPRSQFRMKHSHLTELYHAHEIVDVRTA